jgi:NAD(P)-dependent dehydrogenase (short-subunit alcohol dehydrogenase family)
MSEMLANRVAIVAGGARGVGFAVAQVLALHGAKVLIVDNGCAVDGQAQDPAVAELAADRVGGVALPASLHEPGVAARAVEQTVSVFGSVDIVVNAAVIARHAPVFDVQVDDLAHVLANNVHGAVQLMQAASAQMRAQVAAKRLPGRIVNLLGASGLFGQRGDLAQSAAHAALVGATRAAALDLHPQGITCNALVPFTNTRTAQAAAVHTAADKHYRDLNQQLPVSPVANVVAWLASAMSAKVTGQVFGVRGRELFLFSQAAPIERVFLSAGVLDADETSDLMLNTLGPLFTPLHTEADVFRTDPII